MSDLKRREWLQSFASSQKKPDQKAVTIAVTSGKGGVGKTSISVKLAKLLAVSEKRVLLIDCDYNLSNTAVKLGLPIRSELRELLSFEKTFSECLHKEGNFHLLSGCNGDIELFESGMELDKLVVDIIASHEHEYDYIILDCPAGIQKSNLNLNAYVDNRIVVVTPDKSSITDSYSLIKILKNRYGVLENHLLVNKVSSDKQCERLVKTMCDTVEHFLGGRLVSLGSLKNELGAVDLFDRTLWDAKSALHQSFVKLLPRVTESLMTASRAATNDYGPHVSIIPEHEVSVTLS